MTRAPARSARLNRISTVVTRRDDGGILMRSPDPLGVCPARLSERLVQWAGETPDRVFIAERTAGGGWQSLTYAETLVYMRSLGQALLDRDLSADHPIGILSGNGIDHALLGLAALHVGIPYAPISPVYSLVSTDFGKPRHVVSLLTSGLVFATDGAAVGVPPEIMGIGPADAIRLVLDRAGLTLDDIDRFEINEAFGAQCIAVERELALDHGKVNVNGGAIAIGHPLGATGIRLTLTLARKLR